MDQGSISLQSIFHQITELENEYTLQKHKLREADSILGELVHELDQCMATQTQQEARVQELLEQCAMVNISAAMVNPVILRQTLSTASTDENIEEIQVDTVQTLSLASSQSPQVHRGVADKSTPIQKGTEEEKNIHSKSQAEQHERGEFVRKVHQLHLACDEAAGVYRKHSLMLGARMVAIARALLAKSQLRELVTAAATQAGELEAQVQERHARELDPFLESSGGEEAGEVVNNGSDKGIRAVLTGAVRRERCACELAVKRLFLRKLALARQRQSATAADARAEAHLCHFSTLFDENTSSTGAYNGSATRAHTTSAARTLGATDSAIDAAPESVIEILKRHGPRVRDACLCEWEREEQRVQAASNAMHQQTLATRARLRRAGEEEKRRREREIMLLERDLTVVRDRVEAAQTDLRTLRSRQ